MKNQILKAIMERYGGLILFFESLDEDFQTTLFNLSDDLNDSYTDKELENYITEIR